MYILSQDRDKIFTLTDKSLMRGAIYAEDVIIDGKYYGTNILGRNFFREYLLGTYEEKEAEQIVAEIYKLLRIGVKFYSMPDPALEPDDLGVNL